MSQENVEILRHVYNAASRGDWDGGLRDAHPDCEARFVAGPQAGTHRGRDEIVAALSDVTAAFDAWIIEPLEFFESGDQTVVIARNRLRPKGTGGEFEYRNGHIWTIRDGTILSLVGYPNPEEALEAAGLSE
ncbi:MAG: nuclear transport factor 2 family protein [Actinomycetota bacterium]